MKTIIPAAIAALTIILTPATAQANPSPKGKSSAHRITIRWADQATRELHPYAKGSFIPRRGTDGTNSLCRSGSKAARWGC